MRILNRPPKTKYFVTHLFVTEPPEIGLRPLSLLVATQMGLKHREYYKDFGSTQLNEELLESDIKNGKIEALTIQAPIKNTETLWMNPDGSIFIGDEQNPYAKERPLIIHVQRAVMQPG